MADTKNTFVCNSQARSYIAMCYSRDMQTGKLPVMKRSEIDRRRAALKRFINNRSLKVKPWCERAGVTPTAVYNFLNGYSSSLEEETYNKLASAAGVPSLMLKSELPQAKIAYAVQVIGAVQAGEWREAMEWEVDQRYTVAAITPDKYAKHCFGLETVGPSMNLIYPEGSVVICVPIQHFDRDLKNGDRVVVNRVGRDGAIESTVKELVVDDNGKSWLWPRSNDPRFQQPISLNDRDGQAKSVEILAVVIGSYRPETNID